MIKQILKNIVDFNKFQLKHSEGLSNIDLENYFNITKSQCREVRILLKLTSNLARNKLQILTQEEQDIIVGSLLGDGSISSFVNVASARYSEGHSIKQKEYLLWKYEKLKILDLHYTETNYFSKKLKRCNQECSIVSKSHQILYEYRKLFYLNNIKIVPINIDKLLTPLALAVWFMDDGCNIKEKGCNISTQSFSKEENNKLINVLKNKFNIESTLKKVSDGNKFILYIKKYEKYKFFSIINPYIISSMNYKILLPSTK